MGLNIYRAHYLSGSQYINENKYHEAIAEWEEYLEKYADDEKTRNDLGELYFRAGITEITNENSEDINKAKINFQKAIELDNNNHIYHYYNGLCDFGLGNYAECITQFNRLVNLQSDNIRLKYHIGLSLLRKGEKERAMNIFNELAKGENKDIYTEYALEVIANVHIKQGNYNEAISILETLK